MDETELNFASEIATVTGLKDELSHNRVFDAMQYCFSPM